MNIFKILQLVTLATTTIAEVEKVHREKGNTGNGAVKKQEVEAVLYASVATLEASGKLAIEDRKGFQKDISKMVDGIVGVCNKSEWK